MKHELSCLIYVCTCKAKKDLKSLEKGLDQMKDGIQTLETFLEVEKRLWPDPAYISPDDVKFMRDVSKKSKPNV